MDIIFGTFTTDRLKQVRPRFLRQLRINPLKIYLEKHSITITLLNINDTLFLYFVSFYFLFSFCYLSNFLFYLVLTK